MTSFVIGRGGREDPREQLFFFFVGSSRLVSLAKGPLQGRESRLKLCSGKERGMSDHKQQIISSIIKAISNKLYRKG
jgi:hypothetical protein